MSDASKDKVEQRRIGIKCISIRNKQKQVRIRNYAVGILTLSALSDASKD